MCRRLGGRDGNGGARWLSRRNMSLAPAVTMPSAETDALWWLLCPPARGFSGGDVGDASHRVAWWQCCRRMCLGTSVDTSARVSCCQWFAGCGLPFGRVSRATGAMTDSCAGRHCARPHQSTSRVTSIPLEATSSTKATCLPTARAAEQVTRASNVAGHPRRGTDPIRDGARAAPAPEAPFSVRPEVDPLTRG